MDKMTFAELLAEDTTETLYPMLLPEDDDGFVWHIVDMTKEEVIATLEANSCKDDPISELILGYNQGYITEFGIDAVKFSELPFEVKALNSPSYFVSWFLIISIIVSFFLIVVGSVISYTVNKFFY